MIAIFRYICTGESALNHSPIWLDFRNSAHIPLPTRTKQNSPALRQTGKYTYKQDLHSNILQYIYMYGCQTLMSIRISRRYSHVACEFATLRADQVQFLLDFAHGICRCWVAFSIKSCNYFGHSFMKICILWSSISKTCFLNALVASSGIEKRWPSDLFFKQGNKKESSVRDYTMDDSTYRIF